MTSFVTMKKGFDQQLRTEIRKVRRPRFVVLTQNLIVFNKNSFNSTPRIGSENVVVTSNGQALLVIND